MRQQDPILIIATALGLSALALGADWKDEIGFTRLQTIAGAELPVSLSQGFTGEQVQFP